VTQQWNAYREDYPLANHLSHAAVQWFSMSTEIVDSAEVMFFAHFISVDIYFRDITLCSPLKVNQRFGGAYRLYLRGGRRSQARNHRESGSKQALKMEAIYSSRTSVEFQQTIRLYIPENKTLFNPAVSTSNPTNGLIRYDSTCIIAETNFPQNKSHCRHKYCIIINYFSMCIAKYVQ
jgi:hypothetical protein